MGRLLGVPEDQTVYVYMPVGYPATPGPQAKKKPFEERALSLIHIFSAGI